MLEEQKQRMMAMDAADQCRRMGMSPSMFREMVDYCSINPPEVNEACVALRDRGELEHLISFVWTFRK